MCTDVTRVKQIKNQIAVLIYFCFLFETILHVCTYIYIYIYTCIYIYITNQQESVYIYIYTHYTPGSIINQHTFL